MALLPAMAGTVHIQIGALTALKDKQREREEASSGVSLVVKAFGVLSAKQPVQLQPYPPRAT